MPSDRAAHWQRLQQLVDDALDLPPDQRSALIDRRCGGDDRLRGEAVRLLRACDRAAQSDGLLGTPAAALAADFGASPVPADDGAVLERLNAALEGRYRVEGELGRGGMATVYRAHDLRHDRTVAIKVIDHHAQSDAEARFLREIRTSARLTHPHLLTVHDSGTADGLLFFVMPFVAGETLRARMQREVRLAIPDVLRLVRELAEALVHAHAHGVVHRDLKPENILVSEGHAIIADFGVAGALAAAGADGMDDAHGQSTVQTPHTLLRGTPAYMAPEQLGQGSRADHRSDLYALGLIVYEALTGRRPLARPETGTRVEPASPDRIRADVPAALGSLVMRLIESDPAMRPQSAREVLHALDGADGAGRRTVSREVAIAGVLLLMLAAGAYGVWRSGDAWFRRGATTSSRAVAVMPFVNGSTVADDEYLADGLTDELALAVSRLPGLTVAGRASTYPFKGRAPSAQEIGRTLGVGLIISGTVRRARSRIRVSVQLASSTDGRLLWGGTYETSAGDLFSVQDELTRAIVDALARALDDQLAPASLASGRGTDDQEAYDLWLRGRYFYLERGSDNLDLGMEYLKRSIARDSMFARAHATLAMIYGVLPVYQPERADTAGTLMAASAAWALALDSTIADAHVAAGGNADRLMRFAEAEAHYRKALALEPSNVSAHHWYGFMLTLTGRNDEAIAETRRAAQLDPLAKSAGAAYAGALLNARRFAEAETEARRVLAIDPEFVLGLYTMGLVQALSGKPDSAIAILEKRQDKSPIPAATVPLLYAYASAGRWADVRRLRTQLRGMPDRQLDAAFADLVLGNGETLVSLLATPAGLSTWYNTYGFGCSPLLDALWEDARIRALARGIGIEPCPVARPWPIRVPPA